MKDMLRWDICGVDCSSERCSHRVNDGVLLGEGVQYCGDRGIVGHIDRLSLASDCGGKHGKVLDVNMHRSCGFFVVLRPPGEWNFGSRINLLAKGQANDASGSGEVGEITGPLPGWDRHGGGGRCVSGPEESAVRIAPYRFGQSNGSPPRAWRESNECANDRCEEYCPRNKR